MPREDAEAVDTTAAPTQDEPQAAPAPTDAASPAPQEVGQQDLEPQDPEPHSAAPEDPAPDETPAQLPPGITAAAYIALHEDLSGAPDLDGATHWAAWGQSELRALLPKGTGLDHPQSRALQTPTERAEWRRVAARRASELAGGLAELVAQHPRALWLRSGFTLPAYLAQHQDVAAAVDDPLEAAFHFLEFGVEEARLGKPDTFEPDFLLARYGVSVAQDAVPKDALRAVLATGVDPLDAALSEAEFWERAGYAGAALAAIFDGEYYHAIASQAGLAPPSFARLTCIHHFLATGAAAGLPVHYEHRFDTAFYRSLAQEILPADLAEPADLRAHWLRRGLRQGLAGNLQSWAKARFGLAIPDALLPQLPVYRLAAKREAEESAADTLEQLITEPNPGFEAIDLSDPEMCAFATSLGDRMMVGGNDKSAEWLYWQVLAVNPHHAGALEHLADILQRQNRLEMVQALRQQVNPAEGTAWNGLGLAESQIACRRYDAAARALDGIPEKALSSPAVAAKYRRVARQLFYSIWDNLGDHVAAYGISRTQDQLRAAMACYTPAFSTARRRDPVRRVALMGNEDLYQCKLYRIDQKVEQLRQAGLEVRVFSPSRELDNLRSRLDEFDAVIFFRVPAFPEIIDAIAACAGHGLLTFYEIDDVVFDADHFPPAFETYAGTIREIDYAVMACGVPLFEHAMGLCDYGLASTATIARLMEARVRTGQVFEHHNALGRLHLAARRDAPAPKPEDTPLVLFYGSGTRAHKEDFHDILEPALAQMLDRYPGQLEIHLIGYFGTFTHLDLARDPVTVMEPVWDFEEFCGRLARADINLSVLRPTLITDAKSEIKWMEAAMFGIPSVVSDTATHREVIEEGVTGLLAHDATSFAHALDSLIAAPELRQRIGAAARQKVLGDYSLETMGAGLQAIFEALRPVDAQPRKRLMVVNVFYPPQAIGGATRVVHDNVRALYARYGEDYDIDVVCTLEGGLTPYEITTYAQDGVRVWAITAPPLAEGDMTARVPQMGQVFDQLLERLSPDLIHFHCIQRLTAAAVDAARLREIPYVITLHDGWWISPNQFIIDDRDRAAYYDYAQLGTPALPARAQALARPLMGAKRLLAVSEPFAALHHACHLEHVSVCENGVSPLEAPSRLPSESGRVRLAHIGGASRHKGIHLVRNALLANDYQHLELLLIDHALPAGETHYETWGSTPVRRSGKVPQAEITALYGQIDVLLAPSIWPESYGLVTREAMACGAWVITGDQGAIGADIVEGETGHVVDISTYQGLAEILAHVDADPERYRRPLPPATELRAASVQADELAALYRQLLADEAL